MKQPQTVPMESSGLVFSHFLDLDDADELAVMLTALSSLQKMQLTEQFCPKWEVSVNVGLGEG